MSVKKFASYEAIERLWLRITQLFNKKLENVAHKDASGRLVEPAHKLSFGPYEYDGTKDVSVTIYDGEYNNE